jgi:hypothetical protein
LIATVRWSCGDVCGPRSKLTRVAAYNDALRRRIRACCKERPAGIVITRADAIGQGFTAYYVEPCKEGHMCGRDQNGGCVDCTRAYRSPKPKVAIERNAATRAERERATAERAARPRYEPKRVASPRLTDEERQAIERARAEKRPVAEREREEERARAKAERTRAEGEASPSRRARGQEALLSFSADEAAAIEAAIAAGKVTKIKRPIDV